MESQYIKVIHNLDRKRQRLINGKVSFMRKLQAKERS